MKLMEDRLMSKKISKFCYIYSGNEAIVILVVVFLFFICGIAIGYEIGSP